MASRAAPLGQIAREHEDDVVSRSGRWCDCSQCGSETQLAKRHAWGVPGRPIPRHLTLLSALRVPWADAAFADPESRAGPGAFRGQPGVAQTQSTKVRARRHRAIASGAESCSAPPKAGSTAAVGGDLFANSDFP
jgi:hypothetical protein